MQGNLLVGVKRSLSKMAAFAAMSGAGRTLSCGTSQVQTHRLPLVRPDVAMLRHHIQPTASRILSCSPLQAYSRRDFSAPATALEEETDIRSGGRSDASLEEEFAQARALQSEQSSLASLFEDEEVVKVDMSDEEDESLLLQNCGLSEATVKGLNKRGIKALFPIQKGVFEPVMAGRDIIGRARTGSGKTLAFALPVIESLVEEDRKNQGFKQRGRTPRCIVLTPTRELAQQIKREFEESAPTLCVGCFYGGSPLHSQMSLLRDGCDIAVGTPGRIQDLMERSASLRLDAIRFAILDEADRMLSDGFEEDVEHILKFAPKDRQTLLFSATMPFWVKKLTRQFQKSPLTVDLVGDDKSGKLAEGIRMLSVSVQPDARRSVLVDLLTVYGAGGKCIVFTQTKRDADEVAASIANNMPTEALHGDIAQNSRERVLKNFRDGKILVLVATDVAARGLDIPNVDLVVHYELPTEVESFLHRSGRTGRAGRAGTAIAMFTPREGGHMKRILKETSITNCEMIGPPPPTDVVLSAAKAVVGRLDMVDSAIVKFFKPAADKVMGSADPAAAMAAALAALSGVTSIPKPRSLLAQAEGYITMRIMTSKPDRITNPGSVFGIVRNALSPNAADKVGKIRMLHNQPEGDGAAFDLPEDIAEQLKAKKEELEVRHLMLDIPQSLPMDAVEDRGDMHSRGGRGGSRGASSRGGSSRGGGGFNRNDSRRGGQSAGGGRRDSYGGSGRGSYGNNDRGAHGNSSRGGGASRGGQSTGWRSAGASRGSGGSGGFSGGAGSWGDRSGGQGRGYSDRSYRSSSQPWDFGK